jgi:hypothetical protein
MYHEGAALPFAIGCNRPSKLALRPCLEGVLRRSAPRPSDPNNIAFHGERPIGPEAPDAFLKVTQSWIIVGSIKTTSVVYQKNVVPNWMLGYKSQLRRDRRFNVAFGSRSRRVMRVKPEYCRLTELA